MLAYIAVFVICVCLSIIVIRVFEGHGIAILIAIGFTILLTYHAPSITNAIISKLAYIVVFIVCVSAIVTIIRIFDKVSWDGCGCFTFSTAIVITVLATINAPLIAEVTLTTISSGSSAIAEIAGAIATAISSAAVAVATAVANAAIAIANTIVTNIAVAVDTIFFVSYVYFIVKKKHRIINWRMFLLLSAGFILLFFSFKIHIPCAMFFLLAIGILVLLIKFGFKKIKDVQLPYQEEEVIPPSENDLRGDPFRTGGVIRLTFTWKTKFIRWLQKKIPS